MSDRWRLNGWPSSASTTGSLLIRATFGVMVRLDKKYNQKQSKTVVADMIGTLSVVFVDLAIETKSLLSVK